MNLQVLAVFAAVLCVAMSEGNAPENEESRLLKREKRDKDDLPPGFVDNPGKAIGVKLKKGRKSKARHFKQDNTITDLDGEEVDLKKLKPINVFSTKHFDLSEDGTYVTDKKTGNRVLLEVFGNIDMESAEQADKKAIFATKNANAEQAVKKAIFATKNADGEFDDIEIFRGNSGGTPSQSFKKEGEFYVGYSSDDVDIDEIRKTAKMASIVPDADEEDKYSNDANGVGNLRAGTGNGNGNGNSVNSVGRNLIIKRYPLPFPTINTCKRIGNKYRNIVLIGVTVDKSFQDACASRPWYLFGGCGSHYGTSRAQSIVATANYRYLLSGCAYLVIGAWDVLGNSPYGSTSGCVRGSDGALQKYTNAKRNRGGMDAWHLFTGVDFTDGGTVGCAWTGGLCRGYAYGVNHMTFTNDLDLQATLFAHELGHNMGAGHSSGSGIMGPYINGGAVPFESGSNDAMGNHIADSC